MSKSGRPGRTAGLRAFSARHPNARPLVIGAGGLKLTDFFHSDPEELLVGG